MNLLNSWLHDYGLAILALTTIIKLTLWPIQNSEPVHASDGRAQPQNAGVEGEVQRRSDADEQELMKLYKQYGINPVGRLFAHDDSNPIFFGLFKMLGQAVELRNAKFSLGKRIFLNRTRLPTCRCWLGRSISFRSAWLPRRFGSLAMTPKTGDPTQRGS